MQYQFIDLLLSVFGINDVDGVFSGLAMSTYWTQDELVRANFSELATGITDVISSIIFFLFVFYFPILFILMGYLLLVLFLAYGCKCI